MCFNNCSFVTELFKAEQYAKRDGIVTLPPNDLFKIHAN